MSPVLRLAVAMACLCLSQGLGPTARAQSPVDEGRQRFEQADFYGALEALREAERSSALDLEELTRLYETRILVHLALGEEGPIQRDLAALATLRPDHALGAEVPPAVRESFRELVGQRAGPLGVDVDVQPVDDQVVLRGRATGDPDGLVREVRLHARVEGGPWNTASDTLRVAAEPGERVEHHAELIGPGGAVVRQRGSREAPLVWQAGGADDPLALGGPARTDDDGGGGAWAWWLAGGAAVAIAVGVVVVLVVSSDDGNEPGGTTVGSPMVMGF